MLTAALVSLAVVFVAELGDKSQLITMTYALRHRWWVVLSGVGIASFLVHGLSVTIGHFLGLTLARTPDRVRRGASRFSCSRCGRGERAATTTTKASGRRTAVRAVRRHLVVRARRTRRQDDARHRRAGQRPQLGRSVDRCHRRHGAGRRRGHRRRRVCCTGGCPSASCTAWPVSCSCCSVCGCCSTVRSGLRWVALGAHRIGRGRRRSGGGRSASPASAASIRSHSHCLNRRPSRSDRRLATVGQTTELAAASRTLTSVTWRRAH